VRQLLSVRPELTLEGKRPTPGLLAARISGFWLSDEVALYIGKTTDPLRKRISAYYCTRIGARSPHAGGRFLRLLSNLDELYVHYAEAPDPKRAESLMLGAFQQHVSRIGRASYYDQDLLIPFANMKWEYEIGSVWREKRRQHGIKGDTARV
jgi:hypothetical protein